MAVDVKAQLLYQNVTKTPLGHIDIVSTMERSAGTGWERMRVFGAYALVYILRGGGTYADANGFTADIGVGDLIWVFPELGHRYGPRDREGKPLAEEWSEIHIVFEGPVFELWRNVGLLNPAAPVMHLEPVEYWYERFRSIGSGGEGKKERALEDICRLQEVMAAVTTAGRRGVRPAGEERWLMEARTLLEAGAARGADAVDGEGIARRMGLPYDRFRKKFAALAGMPPGKYAMAQVIQRARRMIHTSAGAGRTLTNRELAEACGFYDEFHFSRRFKQVVGLSPSQYRERLPRG